MLREFAWHDQGTDIKTNGGRSGQSAAEARCISVMQASSVAGDGKLMPRLLTANILVAVHKPTGSIVIQGFLGANSLMVADELDAIVFRMAFESAHALPLGFTEKAVEIAARSHGVLLFDLRIDGDVELQRVAVIRYPSNQAGVLMLGKLGSVTSHCMINGDFSCFMAPLEDWNTLPLSVQARTSIAGPASLFIGALRKAGCIPLGRSAHRA